MRALLLPALTRFLGGLRFRSLFVIAAVIFLLDLFTPDLIVGMPVDELFLAVVTLILSQWKKRKEPDGGAVDPPAATPRPIIELPADQVRREG